MATRLLYALHPRPLTVLYGELENHAAAQHVVLVGTPGSLLERHNAGGFRFYARQFYDAEGRKREAYVAGPIGDEQADVRAEALRQQIDQVKEVLADVRLLGREGFQIADARTYATLAALHNHGLFRAGALVIGSHAFGILLNQLGVKAAAYATEDVDVARAHPLALAEPLEHGLLEMLRTTGLNFVEVPALDVRQPSTSWKTAGRGRFHVDLLVPASDDAYGTIAVPELRAHATALPFLRYLLEESLTAPVLAREGCCTVRVPNAERFALHKLLVSQLRSGRSAKSTRDLEQAAILLAALAEHHAGAIEAARAALPAGGRRYLVAALAQLRPMLEPAHPRAWAELTDS